MTLHFDYSTIISVVSLGVSIVVFILVYLRPPSITSVLGPKIMLYYKDFDFETTRETFGLQVPVAFLNTAMKTGLVLSAWLLIHREDTPQERYRMEWNKFGKFTEKGWVFEDEAHALAVPGNSSVARTICFYWQWDSDPKLVLREGVYNVALCFQVERCGHLKMKIKTHEMRISRRQYRDLEDKRAKRSSETVYARLDVELPANQIMTESESRKVFGLTN
jgi:YD repeat-containing protein